jgi:hypothetical protein
VIAMSGQAQENSITTNLSAHFDFATLSDTHLLLGLPVAPDDQQFVAFDLIVLNHGAKLLSQHFASAADFAAFFSDRSLDLGLFAAGNQQLKFDAIGSSDSSLSLRFDYLIGIAPGVLAVPEPALVWLMLAGLMLMASRSRRTLATRSDSRNAER